jgi:hypothetical protein
MCFPINVCPYRFRNGSYSFSDGTMQWIPLPCLVNSVSYCCAVLYIHPTYVENEWFLSYELFICLKGASSVEIE